MTFFGHRRCPEVTLEGLSVAEAIAEQSDKISISGVQDKVIVDLDAKGECVRPAAEGRYILKVAVAAYKHLPENEHLSMNLARLVGLSVPWAGLIEMPDGTPAYMVKRFDQTSTSPASKLRQEDFCSLSGRMPAQKYDASAEECAGLVRKHTVDAEDSSRRLFLLFVFSFWIGNDDLHLKNLSMAQSESGGYTLSLAYDLLCTRLYPQVGKGMALPLNGRELHHQRADFHAFATTCGLGGEETDRLLDALQTRRHDAEAMIDCSALPRAFQAQYRRELNKKDKALARTV
jgi:serine/threonine-protein kinase HipA